jgi:amino acid transporter
LLVFAVGASSPMTVLAGGIPATYATTGVRGVALGFLVIGLALALLSVGYVAMARHVEHAAIAYALIARGLGRVAGVGAGAVAIVAYNAIQVSLYPLLGVTVAGVWGGVWWAWAGVAWAVVGLLGLRNVRLSARLLGITLCAEIALIAWLDLFAFTHPHGGHLTTIPLRPSELFGAGVGGVFALCCAAFAGYESTAVFGEETRGRRTVARATFIALAFLAVFYAASAWALAAFTGADHIIDDARNPDAGLPFSVLAGYGSTLGYVATALLVTSIFAAMVSFHQTVARYLFALGRERVMPNRLARLARSGAPVGGSVVQSVIAAAVLVVCVLMHVAPFAAFTGLSTVGAIGILALLVAASGAALRFFAVGGGTNESSWVRVGAPTLGILAGGGVLVLMVTNVNSLLGVGQDSILTVIIPGVVAIAAVVGLLWGWCLSRVRLDIYQGISYGRRHPLADPDFRLADRVI